MSMATNEISFTIIPTVFAAIFASTTATTPDYPPPAMTPTSFQGVVYAVVARVAPVATTGPDNIPSGTWGRS